MKVKVRFVADGLKEGMMNLVNLPRAGEQLILKGEIIQVIKVTLTPDNHDYEAVIEAIKIG